MTTAKVKKITKDIILEVYGYKEKFGDKITTAELAKLAGIGESTVQKIFAGYYDDLLKETKEDTSTMNSTTKCLNMLSEQLAWINNGLEKDHENLNDKLNDIHKELTSIGDLLHIIAVYLMRTEKNTANKTKMATQIQAVHTTKRISDALK